MSSFKMNPYSKPILIEKTQNGWHLTHENVYPHYIDWCVKNPLGVVDRVLSHDILVIVSFYKLKFGDPFKSHEIAPYLRLPVDFYKLINVLWINIFVSTVQQFNFGILGVLRNIFSDIIWATDSESCWNIKWSIVIN